MTECKREWLSTETWNETGLYLLFHESHLIILIIYKCAWGEFRFCIIQTLWQDPDNMIICHHLNLVNQTRVYKPTLAFWDLKHGQRTENTNEQVLYIK